MCKFQERLEKLVRAVCETYRKDATSPSVIVSLLEDGQWYGSIVRYGGRYATNKIVLVSYKGCDAHDVVYNLAQAWLISIGRSDAIENLIFSLRSE